MSFWTFKTSARVEEDRMARNSAVSKAEHLKPGIDTQFAQARRDLDIEEAAQKQFSGQIREIFKRAGVDKYLDAPLPRSIKVEIADSRSVMATWKRDDGKMTHHISFRFVQEHFGPVHIEYVCLSESDLGQYGDGKAARTRTKDTEGYSDTHRYVDTFKSVSRFDDFNDFLYQKEVAPKWFANMLRTHI